MKTVLVAGFNGYIGNALVQRLLFNKYKVIGLDCDIKYKWVKEIQSKSVIPTKSINAKMVAFNKIGKFSFYRIDIAQEPNQLKEILKTHSPDCIINLAQQPSAAYSHLSLKSATETLTNNTTGTLNMLWCLSDLNLKPHYIEIESMGTHDPTIGIDIPEGYFYPEMERRKTGKESIFPKRPGSLYHLSKTTNTYLVDCSNRWWNIPITAINQAIVYGNRTLEIEETNIHSPMWIDECFGTVINRFISQYLLNVPLTIYGAGNHKRGFIGLNDSVQAIMLLIDNPPEKVEGVRFVNQLDNVFSIDRIATLLSDEIQYIPSPRVEDTEDFYYNPITNTLKNLGFKKTTNILTELEFAMKHIDMKILQEMKYHVQPKIKWRKNV